MCRSQTNGNNPFHHRARPHTSGRARKKFKKMESIVLNNWQSNDKTNWIGDKNGQVSIIARVSDREDSEHIARRLVAAWNYCAGVPTAELESKGADAPGFWGRACARLSNENSILKVENAALRAAVREMERMLPVLEYLQISSHWELAVSGEDVSFDDYRQTLLNALAKMNEK